MQNTEDGHICPPPELGLVFFLPIYLAFLLHLSACSQ